MNVSACCTPSGANFCPHCGQPLRAYPSPYVRPTIPDPHFPAIPWQPPWYPGIYVGDVFPEPIRIWCQTSSNTSGTFRTSTP